MIRIPGFWSGGSASNAKADKFGGGKNGFQRAAPPTIPHTVLDEDWFDDVQESIVRVIEGAGLTPDGTRTAANWDQLKLAINKVVNDPFVALMASNWTERVNPKNFILQDVTWNGSIFVAVGVADGADAYIVTSPDGITWTERANPKNYILRSVIWNGSIFVAVGYPDGTDAYIVTSPDGITWTERANPKNFQLRSVTWSSSRSFFLAVGAADGTGAYMVTSLDGITWTERPNPKNFDLNEVTWNGSIFVAVGVADGTDAYLITSLAA